MFDIPLQFALHLNLYLCDHFEFVILFIATEKKILNVI